MVIAACEPTHAYYKYALAQVCIQPAACIEEVDSDGLAGNDRYIDT